MYTIWIIILRGEKVDLTKGTNLSKIMVGLGWDTNKYKGTADFDLDVSAFLLNDREIVTEEIDLVFYNNLVSRNRAVVHTGDNRVGGSEDNDEEIFSKIPEDIVRVVFVVTIHEASERKQNFGLVDNAYINVMDMDSNKELLEYVLTDDFGVETSVIIAELYKSGRDWKFKAVGEGLQKDLSGLCSKYGVSTA